VSEEVVKGFCRIHAEYLLMMAASDDVYGSSLDVPMGDLLKAVPVVRPHLLGCQLQR
jgi:hypothetical protein